MGSCVQVSGLRTYQWNAMTKRWEDEVIARLQHFGASSCAYRGSVVQVDSHDLEGLLTRDLMRFCAGIPLF
jgi:hypothetical protein